MCRFRVTEVNYINTQIPATSCSVSQTQSFFNKLYATNILQKKAPNPTFSKGKGCWYSPHRNPRSGFKDFLLKPELLRAIVDCGFEHPSEAIGSALIMVSRVASCRATWKTCLSVAGAAWMHSPSYPGHRCAVPSKAGPAQWSQTLGCHSEAHYIATS